jgi:hypothetical protein
MPRPNLLQLQFQPLHPRLGRRHPPLGGRQLGRQLACGGLLAGGSGIRGGGGGGGEPRLQLGALGGEGAAAAGQLVVGGLRGGGQGGG